MNDSLLDDAGGGARAARERCPRCGSQDVQMCGESVEYTAEQWAGQPAAERELRTLAFQCRCGLAFTATGRRDGADGRA